MIVQMNFCFTWVKGGYGGIKKMKLGTRKICEGCMPTCDEPQCTWPEYLKYPTLYKGKRGHSSKQLVKLSAAGF